MRNFAQNRQSSKQTNRQTNSSNTEATLIPCGLSGERANNAHFEIRFFYNIEI